MEGDLAAGFFVAPSLFGDVDDDSELAHEEIFGPVLSVLRFHDEAEALQEADDSELGLGAFVYTRDLARAYPLATQPEAGLVVANAAPSMSPNAPFGGYKQSGAGREGGRQGIMEYLRPKNILIGM